MKKLTDILNSIASQNLDPSGRKPDDGIVVDPPDPLDPSIRPDEPYWTDHPDCGEEGACCLHLHIGDKVFKSCSGSPKNRCECEEIGMDYSTGGWRACDLAGWLGRNDCQAKVTTSWREDAHCEDISHTPDRWWRQNPPIDNNDRPWVKPDVEWVKEPFCSNKDKDLWACCFGDYDNPGQCRCSYKDWQECFENREISGSSKWYIGERCGDLRIRQIIQEGKCCKPIG